MKKLVIALIILLHASAIGFKHKPFTNFNNLIYTVEPVVLLAPSRDATAMNDQATQHLQNVEQKARKIL